MAATPLETRYALTDCARRSDNRFIAVFVKRHSRVANDGTDTGTEYSDNAMLVVIPARDSTDARAD
jgi:hypothetical protein